MDELEEKLDKPGKMPDELKGVSELDPLADELSLDELVESWEDTPDTPDELPVAEHASQS